MKQFNRWVFFYLRWAPFLVAYIAVALGSLEPRAYGVTLPSRFCFWIDGRISVKVYCLVSLKCKCSELLKTIFVGSESCINPTQLKRKILLYHRRWKN